jgi:hypothetical protein
MISDGFGNILFQRFTIMNAPSISYSQTLDTPSISSEQEPLLVVKKRLYFYVHEGMY